MEIKKKRPAILTGEYFMNGDIACAEGAIACGCRFFGGYPITPATEIAERMSERLPEVGGTYIQFEDEIASMAAILGASWGGKKSMTATSGPGFSLMMENLGLGIVTETPTVVVDVQRGGPSTGLPTLVGQADIMQARHGSHGDYAIIALSPSSPQECFDLTFEAFNLSEKYRLPVLVMSDEVVGHMTEKVVIPPEDELLPKIYPRRCPDPKICSDDFQPYAPDQDLVPPMAIAGSGYHIHVTGLTHDIMGFPAINDETQHNLVYRLINKILKYQNDIIKLEELYLDDAEVVVVSFGISARTSMRAIQLAREEGIKVGLLRLITIWPSPEQRIKELAQRIKAFVVVELNRGQMALEIERLALKYTNVIRVTHPGGGGLHSINQILNAIRSVKK